MQTFNDRPQRRRQASIAPLVYGPCSAKLAACRYQPNVWITGYLMSLTSFSPFFSNPTPSSDNLVGMHKNRLRNGEAERLGGLEIDNKFVLSRMTTST